MAADRGAIALADGLMERQKYERKSVLAVAMLIFFLIFNNDTILGTRGVL